MLNDVIANFLATLSEVEFFDAFAAMLRANGFYDVHLTHGTAEHGKDFIAKRVEDGVVVQYGIQTKVGDIGVSSFRDCRNQIESIRTTDLSHPAFDAQLTRRGILATTGRLTGQAPTEAQDYKRKYDSEEFSFDTWQISNLLDMVVGAPETGLAGEPDAALLGAVAAVHEGTFDEDSLDRLSTGWANPIGEVRGLWRMALSAMVLANRLARFGRRDLAALVGAHLVRAAWARGGNADPPPAAVLGVADAGRGLLSYHAAALFDEAQTMVEHPGGMIDTQSGLSAYVTYPVRCLRLLELVGLMGLAESDPSHRRAVASFCADFILRQPGASHPISDRWAVCIPPAALLVHELDPDLVGRWLQEIAVWVADHYERDGLGFAGPSAKPAEEVARLLGSSLEHLQLERRPDCLTASVILDLSATFEMGEVYDSIVNEMMAARVYPTVVECDEGTGLYQDASEGVYIEPWIQYDGHYGDSEGWQCSGPHRRASPFFLQSIGRYWDLLAICSVMRDRCFPLVLRDLAGS